jgi:DNA replication protein
MPEQAQFRQVMVEGSVVVPFSLLKNYKQLGLHDEDVLVLLQLMAYADKEQNGFPTFDELAHRMTMKPNAISKVVQRLMKSGWLAIEHQQDERTQMTTEGYNLSLIIDRLAQVPMQPVGEAIEKLQPKRNLYRLFETEFARPLSPMECEMIESWETQDHYPYELIVHALKEAVFAGKLHFRYIDRILLDWQHHKVRTVEQAKQHSHQFRMERK